MALEHLPMANSSRPSLRDRIFAPRKQQDVGDRDSRRVPFYRRKGVDSATTHSLVKASPRSFLSKVVTKVVPCVSGPATPIDIHPNGTALRDLSSQDLVSPPLQDLDISPPLAAGFSITPSSSGPPSPVDSDTDIVVPPPVSATLLPEDETDGMTSGAVQPPGSSGTTEMFHTPASHDSDSDRTSYSEDDHLQDEIDEEERLIRNGGSGIPIDLVCPLPNIHLQSILTTCFFIGRSAKTLAPARSAGASRSQMSCP